MRKPFAAFNARSCRQMPGFSRSALGVALAAICATSPGLAEPVNTPPAGTPGAAVDDPTQQMAQDLNNIFAEILKMGSEASKAEYGRDLIAEMAKDAGLDPANPLGGPVAEKKSDSDTAAQETATADSNNPFGEDPTKFLQDMSKATNGVLRTGIGMYGKLLQAELEAKAKNTGTAGASSLAAGVGSANNEKATALVGEGNLKLISGDAAGAEKLFGQALVVNPHYADAYYNLAAASALLKKNGAAARALNKAITLDVKYKEMASRDASFSALVETAEFKALLE